MQLYKTKEGNILRTSNGSFKVSDNWDSLVNQKDLHKHLSGLATGTPLADSDADKMIANGTLPPIGSQEVWASGVTYLRSRDARMEESKDGGNVYDRVYAAERPEIFFKATPHRVVGPEAKVRIRQ